MGCITSPCYFISLSDSWVGAYLGEVYRTRLNLQYIAYSNWSSWGSNCARDGSNPRILNCVNHSSEWTVYASPTAQSSVTPFEMSGEIDGG